MTEEVKHSRRDFAKLVALSGTVALFPDAVFARTGSRESVLHDLGLTNAPLRATPSDPDEKFWQEVRARFLLPRDLAFMNAANLCPVSLPVLEAVERNSRIYEASPTSATRNDLLSVREEARRLLAESLRVTPDEIVITRNTSEGNNYVSSGIQLGAGDEVVLYADNHPSNLRAWTEKAKRFGYSVVVVPLVQPHPGAGGYVDAFRRAFTPRTRVVAFSHVSSNSGDLLPAAELCRAARERGVLSLVDGAQTFGVLDVDLGTMRPDFYTGSLHKWPCGPKETGLLYVNREVHDRIWPSVISLYSGAVGISQKLEGHGQRDDAKLAAAAESIRFRSAIGNAVIERRSRALAQGLIDGLSRIAGVTFWTDTDPARRAAVVIIRPGGLDPRKLGDALINRERIVVAIRAGEDRPGLRFSPHFYNTMDEIDGAVDAIRGYIATGL